MIANIVIGRVIAVLVILAVRHIIKKRSCGDCGCGCGKDCHCNKK